jgi:hypothetical protein
MRDVLDRLADGNGCLHEAIQNEAYFISMRRQDGDALGH